MNFIATFRGSGGPSIAKECVFFGVQIFDEIKLLYGDVGTEYFNINPYVPPFKCNAKIEFELNESRIIPAFFHTSQVQIDVPEEALNAFVYLTAKPGLDLLDKDIDRVVAHHIIDEDRLKKLWKHFGYDLTITNEEINDYILKEVRF